MENNTILLGGKEYSLISPGIKKSREWRRRFTAFIDIYAPKLQSVFKDIGSMSTDYLKSNQLSDIKIEEVFQAIPSLYEVLRDVMNNTDELLGLLCDYSPALFDNREQIDENATDEELLKALFEVVKLAYPFGLLTNLSKQTGLPATQTLKN